MQKSQIGDLQHPMLSAPLYISCYNMMEMSRYNIDEAIVLRRWNQTSSVFNFSWPWVTAD
jgi:hypothetical protein